MDMTPTPFPALAIGQLSDDELESRLKRLAAIERRTLALMLVHLGEFDERRLYEDRGQPSLFSYCVNVLGYSEQAAYKRIQAARAARAHPEILRRLEAGDLNLTTIVILKPHLAAVNAGELLDQASGRRTREVEALAARLAPRPDAPDCIRALGSHEGLPVADPRDEIRPLSADRYLFRFTGGKDLSEQFYRAQALLSGARLSPSMEAVMGAGLDALLDKLDPARRGARREARGGGSKGARVTGPRSRRIPAAVRDEVWNRDGSRCTFLAPDGKRCPSTWALQIDHIRPYALGGPSDDAANLRLMCGAHNRLLARRVFGPGAEIDPELWPRDYP